MAGPAHLIAETRVYSCEADGRIITIGKQVIAVWTTGPG